MERPIKVVEEPVRTTAERPAPGVVVVQPARGYRYAADPFLLLGVALEEGIPRTALDLGTGCGLIPLLLARLGVDAVGVEAQPAWAQLWEQSLRRSAVAPVLRVGRVQDLPAASVELVTCNPPYNPANTGPVAPDPLKAAAHTELDGTLADFVAAAERSLGPDGRAVFIVPRRREEELAALFRAHRLWPRERVRIGPRRSVVVGRRRQGDLRCRSIPARGGEVDVLYARSVG